MPKQVGNQKIANICCDRLAYFNLFNKLYHIHFRVC